MPMCQVRVSTRSWTSFVVSEVSLTTTPALTTVSVEPMQT